MGLRRTTAATMLAGILALALVAGTARAQGAPTATAELRTGEGKPVGTAEFVQTPQGVEIMVEVTGNVPPGRHGLHIHQKADLSRSDFESAGDHLNPTDAEHGFENPKGPHAGDLENITVAENGTAGYSYTNDRVTLSPGPNSILDAADGSALIMHEMADDYRTDYDPQTGPGTSGDRIAAGAIEASGSATASAATVPDTGGPALLPLAALLAAAGAGALFGARHLLRA